MSRHREAIGRDDATIWQNPRRALVAHRRLASAHTFGASTTRVPRRRGILGNDGSGDTHHPITGSQYGDMGRSGWATREGARGGSRSRGGRVGQSADHARQVRSPRTPANRCETGRVVPATGVALGGLTGARAVGFAGAASAHERRARRTETRGPAIGRTSPRRSPMGECRPARDLDFHRRSSCRSRTNAGSSVAASNCCSARASTKDALPRPLTRLRVDSCSPAPKRAHWLRADVAPRQRARRGRRPARGASAFQPQASAALWRRRPATRAASPTLIEECRPVRHQPRRARGRGASTMPSRSGVKASFSALTTPLAFSLSSAKAAQAAPASSSNAPGDRGGKSRGTAVLAGPRRAERRRRRPRRARRAACGRRSTAPPTGPRAQNSGRGRRRRRPPAPGAEPRARRRRRRRAAVLS